MTRAPEAEVDEAEALLIGRIHTKGLLHLSLDEVEAAYRARALPEKWQRVTGSRMPEQLLVDITERLRRVNRLKHDSTVDPAAPGSGLAFLKAVTAGETGSVRRCLESRDRRRLMDISDEQQRGCVHVAARAGHAEVLTLLFEHGAHMDTKDRFGRTPLHLACEYGRVPAVQMLLDAGSQPANVDKNGRTALHFAACCEDAQICRLLLAQHPGLVNCCDSHGRKSLFYSVLNVHPTGQSEITTLLLEHRCEVNDHDAHSRAPLHYAAEDGRKAAVGMLLRLQADPAAEEGINGQTPLQMASNDGVRGELRRAIAQRSVGSRCPAPTSQPEPAALASEPSVAAEPAVHPEGGRPATVQFPGVCSDESQFQELQSRFLKIMERVQEGGLEQMEHIKRPHLFNGSWMVDVDTHQKLLGDVLRNVPGPEVCLRVFNLLRPPRQFPTSRGDERDIISYYTVPRELSAGDDTAVVEPEKQMTRAELLRAVQEQRHELEARHAKVQALQQQVEKLHAELAESVDQHEVKLLKGRLEKAQAQLSTQSEALAEAQREACLCEGQVRGLTKQLKDAQEWTAELFTEKCCWQQQLEQAEHLQQRVDRSQAEAVRSEFQWQLREAETERISTVAVRYEAQTEVRQVREELLQRNAETTAELSAERTRSAIIEHQLNSESLCAKQWMNEAVSEAHAAQTTLVAESNRWEAAASEAHALQAELLVQKQEASAVSQAESDAAKNARLLQAELLAAKQEEAAMSQVESKVQRLEMEKDEMDMHYRTLFSHYNLLGQLFLGNQQHGTVPRSCSPRQTIFSPPQTVSRPCTPPQQHVAQANSQPLFPSSPQGTQSVSQPLLPLLSASATLVSPLPQHPVAPLEQTLRGTYSAASTSPLLEGTSRWEPADDGVAPLEEAAAVAGLLCQQTRLEEVLTGTAAAEAAADIPEPHTAQPIAQPPAPGQPASVGATMAPLVIKIKCARGLRRADWAGQSEPYCVCQIPGRPDSKFQTKTVSENLNPVWNHEGVIKVCEAGDDLLFEIWDSDFGKKDEFLGKAKVLSGDFFLTGCERELSLQGGVVEGASLSVSIHLALVNA